MTFKINPIKPVMDHKDKVYEYARRISHYSLVASEERSLSKVFKCENIARNLMLFSEACGCFKHGAANAHKPCDPCVKSHNHYLKYRDAVNKKAAALRQLNKEMNKC